MSHLHTRRSLSLPAKKLAALFKRTVPKPETAVIQEGKPAAPAPALAPASPEEAIRLATRSTSTEELGKKGIDRIRLLSESKLEELIIGMVEAKVHERIEARLKADSTRHSQPEALREDSDLKRRLRAEYEMKWEEFQANQNSKLISLKERVDKAQETFMAIESAVEHLVRPPHR